jgi:hypothetical protein
MRRSIPRTTNPTNHRNPRRISAKSLTRIGLNTTPST